MADSDLVEKSILDAFSQPLVKHRANLTHLKITQEIGFEDCRTVVVESILDVHLVRGSGTLIERPNMWCQSKESETEFEWVLTSVHNIGSHQDGSFVLHQMFRVRIPILSNWEHPEKDFTNEDCNLYHDYTFPIIENHNTFIYTQLHETETRLALLRIPPHDYRRGISHGLFPSTAGDWVISGFSEVVKYNKVAVLLTVDTGRDGNQADVDRLSNLLPKLGYNIVIKPKNPTKRQMISTLKDLKKLKGSYDSLLVVIACHGGTCGHLRASDGGMVALSDLQELVNGENARAFRDCPKIFIISACRGEEGLDILAFRDTIDENEGKNTSSSNAATDFYTAYATVEGYVAHRHAREGTFFLQSVCEVWAKDFFTLSIGDLMTKVRAKLKTKYEGHQVSESSTTLMRSVVAGTYEQENTQEKVHYIPHFGPIANAEVVTKSTRHCVLTHKCESAAAQVGGSVIVHNGESSTIIGVHTTKELTVLITAPIFSWISENLDDEDYEVYEQDASGMWKLLTCGDWEEGSEDFLEDKPEDLSTAPCNDQKKIDDPQMPEIVLTPECNDKQKAEDLEDHVLDLVKQLESTVKIQMGDVVWNEDLGAQAISLEGDIKEHFRELYELNPIRAHEISVGKVLLHQLFQELCKNTALHAGYSEYVSDVTGVSVEESLNEYSSPLSSQLNSMVYCYKFAITLRNHKHQMLKRMSQTLFCGFSQGL